MGGFDNILDSMKDMEGLLKIDGGFEKILSGMPASLRELVVKTMTDEKMFRQLIGLLPEHEKKQAAAILDGFTTVPEEALALYKQCRYHEARTRLRKTIEIYDRLPPSPHASLDQALSFVARRVQALTYNLLGDVENALGDIAVAADCYETALELAEPLGDVDTIVKALMGMCAFHWERGDLEGSLESGNRALALISGQRDRWQSHSKILTTLSCIYSDIGQDEQACTCATEAIMLCEEQEDYQSLPICINNLACLYLETGDAEKAIPLLEEGGEIARQHDHPQHEALMLNNLGMSFLHVSTGAEDTARAAQYFELGMQKAMESGSTRLQAMLTGNMGYVHQRNNRLQEAAASFSRAAEMFRSISAKSDEARYLAALAEHRRLHMADPGGAVQAGKAAIQIYESVRGGLKKEAHRISYAAGVTDPYETAVISLISLRRGEEALEYIERAKSRALLELISARIMEGGFIRTDSEIFHQAIQLLVEMDEIRRSLNDTSSLESSPPSGGADEPDVRAHEDSRRQVTGGLRAAMEEKEQHFERLLTDLDAGLSDNADLLAVRPLSAGEIRDVLDEQTFLLEMFQTEDQLYLICMSHDAAMQVFPVALSASEAMDIVASVSESIRESYSWDVRSHDYIRQVLKPLQEIYALIAAPLQEWFRLFKRCLIIPHLCWHYFPFHALFDGEEKVFLCDQIEIGFCPSAGILRQCKQKDRLTRQKAILMAHHEGDLPLADAEVQLLSKAFAEGGGDVYTGEEARLDRASGVLSTPYDIVHLACHGWFNGEHPFLSGVAIPPGAGEERHTFLLDFFNLKMPCTQITISACESGLSRFTSADELIGLSRGLFGAGAASLLLSLWKVADESTCYLMENYYWHFVRNQQTKTRSLQLAMQAVKARKEYAHPYYWAPFVLMGDWR